MTDRQKKAVLYIGLFGLCFLFIWFASFLYTDDKKDTNRSGTEELVDKDAKSSFVIKFR